MKNKINFQELSDLIKHIFQNGDEKEGYAVCWGHYFGEDFSQKEKLAEKKGNLVEKCEAFEEFLKGEIEDMIQEIDANKYYLSQKKGYDIGLKEAMQNYVENHSFKFGEGYRSCYCNRVCKHRLDCDLSIKEKDILDDE